MGTTTHYVPTTSASHRSTARRWPCSPTTGYKPTTQRSTPSSTTVVTRALCVCRKPDQLKLILPWVLFGVTLLVLVIVLVVYLLKRRSGPCCTRSCPCVSVCTRSCCTPCTGCPRQVGKSRESLTMPDPRYVGDNHDNRIQEYALGRGGVTEPGKSSHRPSKQQTIYYNDPQESSEELQDYINVPKVLTSVGNKQAAHQKGNTRTEDNMRYELVADSRTNKPSTSGVSALVGEMMQHFQNEQFNKSNGKAVTGGQGNNKARIKPSQIPDMYLVTSNAKERTYVN